MSANDTLGKLYGVGVGPGDPQLLTLRAVDLLCSVDVIFHVVGPRSRSSVSEQIVDSIEACTASREALVFSMATDPVERHDSVVAAAVRVVAALESGKNCAFATIGDPLIYSTFTYLQKEVQNLLPDVEIEVVPGITSFQAAAAVWGKPLVEDNEVLSVIPRWNEEGTKRGAMAAADTAILLKTYRDRSAALGAIETQMQPDEMLYAARMGLEDQVVETDPETIAGLEIEYLSLLIAKRGTRD